MVRKVSTIMHRNIQTYYFAGGCFWGLQEYFRRLHGVLETQVGYANGDGDDAHYDTLKQTHHAECVKVTFDTYIISPREILLRFFKVIDPSQKDQQGNDIGEQYRTAIFYTPENNLDDIQAVVDYERPQYKHFYTLIEPLKNFVPAEQYHQDYLQKNPQGYCHINPNAAWDPLFDDVWTIVSDDELKTQLDELSYNVLRYSETEAPHTSELNHQWQKGIYVDKATGQPLFASSDKFDQGCGWPSFSRPITSNSLTYLLDSSFGRTRTEVKSYLGNHLGHVFSDGPRDKGGKRYCINGAALKFIPYDQMDEMGYSKYKILVD